MGGKESERDCSGVNGVETVREVSIKNLYKRVSKEILDLPFAVTKNGKVIGYMVESLDQPLRGTKPDPKKSLDNSVIPFRPYSKADQLRKKHA